MLEIDSIKSKLTELEKEYELKKKAITQAVEKDLLAAIDTKKTELKKLEDEYAKLTGKAPKASKSTGKRPRLSRAEQDAVQQRLADFLRGKDGGARMKELVAAGGANAIATRRLLMQIPGIQTHGARATMIYKLA